MNLTGFIVARELKTAPRRKRFYLKRVSIVILLGTVLLLAASMGRGMRSTTMGLEIFRTLSFAALIGLSFVALTSAANLIVREKEERTLGLLLLTEVSGWNIMLGKLFTALFGSALILMSVLPLILLCVSLGGVSSMQVLASMSLILTHAVLVSTLGLLGASITHNERSASGAGGLLWILCFFIFPLMLGVSLEELDINPPRYVLFSASPFLAMGEIVGTGRWEPALANSALSLLVAIPATIWAQRAMVRGANNYKAIVPKKLHDKIVIYKANRARERGVIGRDNPVYWRDYEIGLGGRRGSWMKFVLSMVSLFLILVWVTLASKIDFDEFWKAALWTGLVSSLGVLGLGGVALCSQAFNKEKQFRALEPLLTTDMEDGEILRGKIKAIFDSLRPWMFSSIFFIILCVSAFSHEHDFWEAFASVGVEYVTTVLGYSALAFWISLRHKRNVGFGMAILVLILWNTLGRYFLGGILELYDDVGTLVAVDALFNLGLAAVFTALCFANFRNYALSPGA